MSILGCGYAQNHKTSYSATSNLELVWVKKIIYSPLKKGRTPWCYSKSPTVQHVFQLIQASSHNCIRDGDCYRIVGNFWVRKLLWISEKYDFHRENFRRLLTFAAPKDTTPQISQRKLSQIATKLWNFWKFLPRKFPAMQYLMHN